MPSTFKPLQTQLTSSTFTSPLAPSGNAFGHNFMRDQFTLTTWLSIGAMLQLVLFALPIKPYYAATPVVAYLVWTLLDHFLMHIGAKDNIYESGALQEKYTAIFPDEDGRFTKNGAKADKICVFILGVKNHHMLGPFSPGFQDIAKHATDMYKDLREHADEYGFLGMSNFSEGATTKTGALGINLMYFKSTEDVTRYSNSPLHRKGWDWYVRFAKDHKNIGLMHELYEIPAGKWENLYVNIQPTGMAMTRHKTINENGEEKWISPIVDASKGKLSTTYGRYEG